MRYNYNSSFLRANIINHQDQKAEGLVASLEATSTEITNTQLSVATFNLFNYLEPPNAFYEFERIYSAEQWQKKQRWIARYLDENQPDIIGFQEVFSIDSLKELMTSQGYYHFASVDEPEIIDDFIYKKPVVAIASRYPIVDVVAVSPNRELAQTLGLTADFSFSRKILRATVDIPHIGHCDCYVVHFKSKRSLIEFDERASNLSPEKIIIESFKAQVAGSWGSTIKRGSEATLLMIDMIERRESTDNPMIIMGDFNNTLSDGVLSHILTNTLRFVSAIDRDAYLAKYCLNDAWDLYNKVLVNNKDNACTINDSNHSTTTLICEESILRTPTHYFGGEGSVLDYILLSCEFDAGYHDSLYQVSDYDVYDRHLINPIFERDGESTDHGVVMITLTLRS